MKFPPFLVLAILIFCGKVLILHNAPYEPVKGSKIRFQGLAQGFTRLSLFERLRNDFKTSLSCSVKFRRLNLKVNVKLNKY